MRKDPNVLENKSLDSSDSEVGAGRKRSKKTKKSESQQTFNILLVSLFIIVLSISLLTTFIIIANKSIKRLEMESNNFRSIEQKYAYKELPSSADDLREISSRLNIKTYTQREAMINILRVADNLNLLYGGVISQDVVSSNGVLSVSMSLNYAPPTAESFIKMIKEFTQARLPMIHISDLDISLRQDTDGIYEVKMHITLSHPYVE